MARRVCGILFLRSNFVWRAFRRIAVSCDAGVPGGAWRRDFVARGTSCYCGGWHCGAGTLRFLGVIAPGVSVPVCGAEPFCGRRSRALRMGDAAGVFCAFGALCRFLRAHCFCEIAQIRRIFLRRKRSFCRACVGRPGFAHCGAPFRAKFGAVRRARNFGGAPFPFPCFWVRPIH